jgi:hypothetical protein
MVDVVTAPTGGYVELATLKSRLGITGTDQDAVLTALISSATTFINGFCKREFRAQTLKETIPGSGEVSLNLQEWPVTSVEHVKINGGEVSDFSADGEKGVLYRDYGVWPMERLASGGAAWDPVGRTGRLNIEVQYSCGYGETPADIQEAAIMYATGMLGQVGGDVGINQKQEGDLSVMYSITAGGSLGFMTYIKDLILEQYRRYE